MNKPLPPEFWVGAFAPLFVIVVVVPLVLLKAWVLTWLWQWYMIPLFGVPPLRLVFAFGLLLTANYLLPTHTETKADGVAAAMKLIVAPLLALMLGWIGTWFI